MKREHSVWDHPQRQSSNRIRNWPQITPMDADKEKGFQQEQIPIHRDSLLFKNSASASICAICGQMPFLLPFQMNFEQKETKGKR